MREQTTGTTARSIPGDDAGPSMTVEELRGMIESEPSRERPPEIVHRRPVALSALWIIAAVAAGVGLAFVYREVDGAQPEPSTSLEVGEFRSLTDDGAPVELRCDERQPSRFGSPCLRDIGSLEALLDGRTSVVLVSNITSPRHPDGAIRCVEVVSGGGSADPTVSGVRCPDHDFVVAGDP